MLLIHPFQRSFCVLFISLAMIFFFLHNKTPIHGLLKLNENASNTGLEDYFANFGVLDNLSNSKSRELFNIVQFLNPSLRNYNETIDDGKELKEIYILGLFELTTKLGKHRQGEGELIAAKMAVRHVNALNILPGYRLVLLVNDTKCDPGVAIDRFFHAIYSKYTIVMLLGSGCSNVTEALANIVPYWNIIQVSYGSKSPTLSDRRKFPLFFRTIAPDSSHNIAKAQFIKHHSWNVVVAFSQSGNEYLLPVNHLITELEKDNVSCISTVTFSIDNYREQLGVLKSLDIHIIIGSFSVEMAPLIFCAAYQLEMHNQDYVWILEKPETPWWTNKSKECSQLQLQEAVHGIFMIGDYEYPLSYGNVDFDDNFNNKRTYDAIWTMALTLGASNVELHKFNYGQNDVACLFFNKMRQLQFVGLSGPVQFKGADRVGDFVLTQLHGKDLTTVAFYDSIDDNLDFHCHFCTRISWKTGQVPLAQRILRTTLVTIPKTIFYVVIAVSLVGVTCSFVFLYFNLKFREMKTIKLSSPNISNLTVTGCILVYVSVIILALHHVEIYVNVNSDELCSARIYLLSTGFSLTFGSMVAKSYRVHCLFTYNITSHVRNKLLRDQQLIGLVLIPLFIDTFIMGMWITADPLKIHLHDLHLEMSGDDPQVVYQPQIELCQCHNTVGWHITLFGYKSIILIMGIYMAWRTRHVKIPELNDSQYIGICVYTTVFSTIIVIVFSLVTEFFIVSFIATTSSILASTTITIVLMFIPKLKNLFGRVDTELSIMESMGLKMECNTRRLICEDPNELMCRLEIQNKVYSCRLQSLDREIARLESLLASNSSSKSSIFHIDPEMHYLNVPRASWPTWQTRSIKGFSSEHKLDHKNMDRYDFFGKLKRFFGSLASLQYSYSNLDNGLRKKIKLRSNPEISGQALVSIRRLDKMKSEGCITNTY